MPTKIIINILLLALPIYAADARGLIVNEPEAFQGYTLYTPLRSTETYLLNMEGEVVHQWTSEYWPSNSAYLLTDGNLLRSGKFRGNDMFGDRGPSGGRVQLFSWGGTLIWDYVYSNESHHQHHDIEPLPNGNVLILAWERVTKEEAIAAGRKPDTIHQKGMFPDTVVEVRRTGRTTGEVVWRWSAWDHLIQDFDASKENYGNPADHPELIDVNLNPRPRSDWMHTNSIDYNPILDQIIINPRSFNEFMVIDHSTTTEEAKGSSGGRNGKGGDILYRWGNPANYRAGTSEDQQFFQQHDARWIQAGQPGAGNITIFNNQAGQSGEDYSSVDEINPSLIRNGSYRIAKGKAFEPEKPIWSYVADPPSDFYSSFISGAERLPNGNTLICSGAEGIFFEVTPEGKTVWEYHNPITLPPLGPEGPHSTFRVVRYRLGYPGIKLK